jgi:hypothetical protein
MVTIVFADASDPVVVAVRELAQPNVHLVPIDELAHRVKSPTQIVTMSAAENQEVFHLLTTKVINRVFRPAEGGLREKLAKWGLDPSWTHVVLTGLLCRSSGLSHDVGGRGVSKSLLPLPRQWAEVAMEGISVRTPRFKHAFGAEDPDTEGLKDPIQKSIWSLFHWSTGDAMDTREKAWSPFTVERPHGMPIVMSVVGEKVRHICENSTSLADAASSMLCRKIASSFASDLGELLFFKDTEGDLVFHAFSPYLTTYSRSYKSLLNDMSEYINKFVDECDD